MTIYVAFSPTENRVFNLYNFTPPGLEPWALLRKSTSFSGGAARYKLSLLPRWTDNELIKIGLEQQGFAAKSASGFSPPEKMHGGRAKWTHSPQAMKAGPSWIPA